MATLKPFPYTAFRNQLESVRESGRRNLAALPPSLAPMLLDAAGEPTPVVACLVHLLDAHKAMLQASFDTALVADELRRHQKFARPGQPSPHVVQLRRQQSVVRQAASRSKQDFIKAAAAFVREAGLEVPQRVALETFTVHWIDANVPTNIAAAE